jgi:hypothetical protein
VHVRLVTTTGVDIDAAVKFIEQRVAPLAFRQRGCVQLVVSGDRSRRTLVLASEWASRADLEASDPVLTKLRRAGTAASGGQETVRSFRAGRFVPRRLTPGAGLVVVARQLQDGGAAA